ncbi:hypothetical protein BJX70DRAFT_398911 [Aspergillus crustosus]
MASIKESPRLLTLPTEILLTICTHLDQSSLSRLTRTNHPLHSITTPELYRHIHIKNHKADGFTAAITKYPSLANHVLSLTVHYHREYEPDDDPQFLYAEALAPTLARLPRLRTLIIKGTNFRDRYQYDIEAAGIENLDHAEFVNLTEAWKEQGREVAVFQEVFLKSGMGEVLAGLRTCELNFSDRAPWDLAKRSAVFLHPTLKRLSILGGYMEDFNWFDEKHRHTTALEELTFLSCHIEPRALRKVLAVPKGLQRFTLKGAGGQLRHHSHPERRPYMKAIEQQVHILQALDLSFPFPTSDVASAVTLHSFPKLEDIAISTRLLEHGSGTGPGEQSIPPKYSPFPGTVKKLHFFDPHRRYTGTEGDEVYLSAIARWVASGDLPGLTEIAFTSRDGMFPDGVGDTLPGTKVVIRRRTPPSGSFPEIDCWCCRF